MEQQKVKGHVNRFEKGNEYFQYPLSGRLKPWESTSSKVVSNAFVKRGELDVAAAVLRLSWCLFLLQVLMLTLQNETDLLVENLLWRGLPTSSPQLLIILNSGKTLTPRVWVRI